MNNLSNLILKAEKANDIGGKRINEGIEKGNSRNVSTPKPKVRPAPQEPQKSSEDKKK